MIRYFGILGFAKEFEERISVSLSSPEMHGSLGRKQSITLSPVSVRYRFGIRFDSISIGKNPIRNLPWSLMSGYFGGYISKKQKVGQFELKRSIDALPMLKDKLGNRSLKASSQLAHICNRFFSVLESKGILRTATEEFLLASKYRPDDDLNAEFIRTFRHRRFMGMSYLQRYELMKSKKTIDVRHIKIPTTKTIAAEFDEAILYGSELFVDASRRAI